MSLEARVESLGKTHSKFCLLRFSLPVIILPMLHFDTASLIFSKDGNKVKLSRYTPFYVYVYLHRLPPAWFVHITSTAKIFICLKHCFDINFNFLRCVYFPDVPVSSCNAFSMLKNLFRSESYVLLSCCVFVTVREAVTKKYVSSKSQMHEFCSSKT